jgi:hypothetical protein
MNRFFSTAIVLGAIACALAAVEVRAGEQEGVRCRLGYEAEISDSNRALKCVEKNGYKLESVCPRVRALVAGVLGVRGVMQESGSDQCYVDGRTVPSVPADGLPGYPPASSFRRVVSKATTDLFVADKYHWPSTDVPDVPYYPGKPDNGVHCPPGFDGDPVYSGTGIRCDKYEGSPIEADCDFGWGVVRDKLGQEDRCVGVNEGPTKPMGMSKIQFDLERALPTVGWVLEKRNGTDLWRKKIYRWPDKVQ